MITDESPSYLAPGLRKLHIPVLLDPAARTLDEAYAQIDELGLATGHAARARALVAEHAGTHRRDRAFDGQARDED